MIASSSPNAIGGAARRIEIGERHLRRGPGIAADRGPGGGVREPRRARRAGEKGLVRRGRDGAPARQAVGERPLAAVNIPARPSGGAGVGATGLRALDIAMASDGIFALPSHKQREERRG